MTRHMRGILLKREERTYTFRIRKPPIDQAVDDLTRYTLAELHAYVVADRPTPDDHLFIVAASNESVTAEQILQALNRLDLNAEFLDSAGEIG